MRCPQCIRDRTGAWSVKIPESRQASSFKIEESGMVTAGPATSSAGRLEGLAEDRDVGHTWFQMQGQLLIARPNIQLAGLLARHPLVYELEDFQVCSEGVDRLDACTPPPTSPSVLSQHLIEERLYIYSPQCDAAELVLLMLKTQFRESEGHDSAGASCAWALCHRLRIYYFH